MKELKRALRKRKDTATGLDDIPYSVLKNLPPIGKTALLKFYNFIWNTGKIPQSFKHAVVIPIPKQDKPPNQAASYRPISLTSHMGKVLETMINNRLNTYLDKNNIISKN